jgi:hypothetical protein
MTAPAFTHARYREILRAGLTAGYRFAGFEEVLASDASSARACFLRHDCDNDLVAAARMAEIEAEEGVRSTYFLMLRSVMYNVLAPANAPFVRRILAQGHWLGLHFDESVVANEPDHRVPALVDKERALLSAEFGCAIDVVSFHQPGARVLEGRLHLNCINTYDHADMAGVHYTSDSNLAFRGGEPAELFASGEHRRLQILFHPEWWTSDPTSLEEKWDRMFIDNLETMQSSLLQREDTFTARRVVRLTRAGRVQ